jgi:hypothetical protein
VDALVPDDDLAAYLQRDLDRITAELALQAASGVVRDYCRWQISEETATFVVNGSGSTLLRLPTLRLTDVTEIRVDDEIIDAAEYRWTEGGLIERPAYGCPRKFRCVQVDATHGWAIIPDAVRAVVLTLASRYYVNPENLLSKTVGSITRTFSASKGGDMDQMEFALLAGFRLP